MLKRKIKSALSLVTLAAFLSVQIGCSMGKTVQNNLNDKPEITVAEKDALSLEYEEAYNNLCTITEAIEKGDSAEASAYAVKMLDNISGIRQQFESEFEDTHEVIDTLDNNVISDRQKSYENEINSRLDAAENAAMLLSENSILDAESIELLNRLFEQPENEFYPTAVPSLTTETEIGYEELKGEIPAEMERSYAAPASGDMSFTAETELNDEIKALADSLGTAKNVYEYVKNNIRYESYYGSRKGAVGTFEQNGGNDTDTASLLVGMLRYLGFPARYHVGTVFITPEQAVMITGADDAENAGRLLASQYKPVAQVTKNGELYGFKMTQTWVDAYVPYTDYRGAGNETGDNVWVSLDASFKEIEVTESVHDCQYNEGTILLNQKIAEMDEDYTASDKFTLRIRDISRKTEKYLPVSLPYQVVSSDRTFSAVPSDMSDRISVDVGWDSLFTKSTAELYGKSITICYEGENDYDDELIQRYGGVENVPAHLVNVVPAAIIGDEIYRGEWGVSLGTAQQMNTYISNRGGTSSLCDKVNAGSVYAINLDLQIISPQDLARSKARLGSVSDNAEKYGVYSGKSLGALLDYAGKSYFTACDSSSFDAEYASDVSKNRMLGLAFTGYTLKTEYFFGLARNLHYGSFYIDVAYNNITAVSYSGNHQDEIKYMLAQGASESAYEGKIWETIFGSETFGVSTMSMFAISDVLDIDRIIITSANADEKLAQCKIDDNTKQDVRNFINQGCIVEIIPQEIKVNKWEGTAYIAYDLDKLSASYMLSGGTAGGSASRDINLKKPSATNMTIDDAMDMCYQINNIIYVVTIAGALNDLAEAAELLSVSSSPLGAVLAGMPAMNAAKAVGEAWVMYYENLEHYVDYAVTGSNEDAIAMLEFTIDNIQGLLKNCIDELFASSLDQTSIYCGEVEISLGDVWDFTVNFFPELTPKSGIDLDGSDK